MQLLHSLALRTLAALGLLSSSAQAQLEAVIFVQGFSSPTYLCSPPGDTRRVFVVEQAGRVRVVLDGNTLPTYFIDIDPIVSSGGERGLLGMAFHPSYESNRKFYLSYTNNSGNSVISEYLRDPANPNVALPDSARTIFGPLIQPFNNHNGGWIEFSPLDGKLYAALGDGGSANDPQNNAQNPLRLLGKVLRFDVDIPFPHVPADNPFTADPSTDDRIWSLGHRNPWRPAFDRLTGDLWIADVGEGAREEINFEPAGAGGRNYGWRCMEGSVCTGHSGCACNAPALRLPVHEYTHAFGCSITGGYRSRSGHMPSHWGRYFFADYCSERIWSFAFDGVAISDLVEHTAELSLPGNENISSFGEDANGTLYIVDQNGGQIWLLRERCTGATSTYCVSSPNSSGPGASIGSAGSTRLSNNDFELEASGLPPNQPGIFYYGTTQTQLPFGNGLRCVGGQTFRLNPPIFAGPAGDLSRPIDFNAPPMGAGPGTVLPGSTWNFQLWYRDPAAGGASFNLSNALRVTFCF